MTSIKFSKTLICCILLALPACANLVSSAVESSLVLIVAHHDKTVEKKQKKYTATHKCVVRGEPEAYALGQSIAYGLPITTQYNIVLSRTGEAIDPVQPHQLAYAFYLIAYKIGDIRAKERIAWMEHYIPPEDAQEIRSIIEDKYLSSHLEKCFTVPDEYRIIKTTRQLILEEQKRIMEQNR